jgi:asparagine synthase (glutamine-hydrolysing)
MMTRSIVIVFNGEIYNYKQLKVNLENRGVLKPNRIQVILRLYEAYGIESFSMLDGMFAFSIHDKKQIKFSLLETFGENLYTTVKNSGFIWASELKSIIKFLPSKPAINKTALNLF